MKVEFTAKETNKMKNFIFNITLSFILGGLFSCAFQEEALKAAATKSSLSEQSVDDVWKTTEPRNANAQFLLGLQYYSGKGVTQNYQEAFNWFYKSAQQGHLEAQNYLAGMYYRGKGVSQNQSEAVKWYRQSAEQGLAKAQYNLGIIYENGYGVPQNLAEAIKWYRQAAQQGDIEAQHNLEVMSGTTQNN